MYVHYTYTCIYTCISRICTLYMHIYIYMIHICRLHIYMCIQTCIYTYMYTMYIHAYIYMLIYICIYTYICAIRVSHMYMRVLPCQQHTSAYVSIRHSTRQHTSACVYESSSSLSAAYVSIR